MSKTQLNSKSVVFAIDFGTSNSLLGATDGRIDIPAVALDRTAPDPSVLRSLLYFPNQSQCYYGQEAVQMYSENQAEGRLIRSIKKFLPSENFLGSWIDNRLVRLEDLISFFLLEMKKRASAELGVDSDTVLLGRPAKFSDDPVKDGIAEHRLRKAATLAGFKNIEFLAEPLAAAFELRKKLTEPKTVLVVDLGGGTSDFTIIKIGPQTFQNEDLLAMGGISIAGDVIDGSFMQEEIAPWFGSKVSYRLPLSSNILQMPKSLLDHICSPADIAQLRKSEYFNFFQDVQRWAITADDKARLARLFVLVDDQLGFDLFENIDSCKRRFTTEMISRFSFDYPDIEISMDVAREDFDRFVHGPSEKILRTMDDTIKAAQISPAQIDLVYCTGGTSKLALIQKGLRDRFSEEKIVKTNFFHSVTEGLVARARELM